jgi:hypothetical protein
MQATTKPLDELNSDIPLSFEELTIFKCDPDEFKKFLNHEDCEDDVCDDVVITAPLMSPMQIANPQMLITEATCKIETKSPLNLEKTLDLLLENITLLISHIHISGIDQTSIVINESGALIDETEIVIEHYDTAPGVFNIEIKACSKLQALLINQKESLCERIACFAPDIKINRLDISSRNPKDYIGDSKQKKVVMGERTKE